MRSKVLSCLLFLSLMFFVGFGSSLTVSAAEVSPDAKNEWFLLPFDRFTNGYVDGDFNSSSGTYYADSPSVTTDWPVLSVSYDYGGVFPIFSSGRDYLVYFTFVSACPQSFNVNRFVFRENINELSSSFELNVISRTSRYVNDTCTVTVLCSFSPSSTFTLSTASAVFFNISPSSTLSGRTSWAVYAIDVTDSSADEVNQIIAAINNQTSSLGGKIDGAADDIQQSIEDQYEGDPGSSFPVDDIITQHNEKMGVLSFGSDTLMQVLGLLSPDQTLSSELVFPSMSLTIAGQRNRVQLWPEYRFDLNTLKQHWPDFIGIMQSLTTALVWIFVLRYCYRVFEKYFLAGGGS